MAFSQQTPQQNQQGLQQPYNPFPNQDGLKRFGEQQPLDINLYKKKDPDQNYGGWGYALNNLMRNPNLLSGGGMMGKSFMPQGGGMMGGLGGAANIGLPFIADLIYGNKYRNPDS